jgi:hypothetical protein
VNGRLRACDEQEQCWVLARHREGAMPSEPSDQLRRYLALDDCAIAITESLRAREAAKIQRVLVALDY